MAERVRILPHEVDDVISAVRDYGQLRHGCTCGPHNAVAAEDLVNAIGEVYERALARGGRSGQSTANDR